MIKKVLIANRGEIACRIARTARRMGITVVAVFSDADQNALHLAQADEAYRLGPAPARESYLSIERLLEVAHRCGADAIHPGYGFLSERADFAFAVAAAGLTFVGPPAAAIQAMGDKIAAKGMMQQAGLPVLGGYAGADQSDSTLLQAGLAAGFPLLIKAAAGGGGRGMRVVRQAEALADALAGARREAANAFGDDRLLLERYLEAPRHIEVQVFADNHGHIIHLFERDCSVQRRHQKVFEEAPAPALPDALRATLGQAAITAARAVGYSGAGTVEFLLDQNGDFYFMEMNTRLQVEHPVTEMIVAQDLVEWQFRVAAGEPLPMEQPGSPLGHAIEVRLYAEAPERDYAPTTGKLVHLTFPAPTSELRVETGVQAGDEIGNFYDGMIAKLVAWGPDRPAALARLNEALAATAVAGVETNLGLLRAVAAHAEYAQGAVDTGFLERNRQVLLPGGTPDIDALLLAGIAEINRWQTRHRADPADPFSPWATGMGWQLNRPPQLPVRLRCGDQEYLLTFTPGPTEWVVTVAGVPHQLLWRHDGAMWTMRIDGRQVAATLIADGASWWVLRSNRCDRLECQDPVAPHSAVHQRQGSLVAPLPGRIVELRVATGVAVEAGAPLLLMEAMKMEHTLTAPYAGTVGPIHCQNGDSVSEGALLLEVIPSKPA